jgi:predicted DCC family thiol-disulfide oxidoreductase YuxK
MSQTASPAGRISADWRFRVKAFAAIVASYLFVLVVATLMGGGWYLRRLDAFYICLLIAFAAYAVDPVRERVNATLNGFAEFLSRRGAFKSDTAIEAPKFALIRILFGVFLVERAIWILVYLQPSDWTRPEIWLVACVSLIAGAMVLVGFFTQFALAYLVLVQWQLGDWALATSTLGNYVGAMLAFLLAFANAGAHFSLDRLLMKRGGRIGAVAAAFYYRDGLPAAAVLQLAKFLTLFGYWLVCVYSLSMHLNEPAWMTGTAGPLVLSNNFMSRYDEAFVAFFSMGEWAVWIGRLALWSMLPWYAVVMPFVLLGGIFRTYVIVWAVLFFLLSLFVLQLGWLAHFEFLLLAGWFWQSWLMTGPRTLHVAYDDRCNLCDRTVNFVKRVDMFGRVELRPLSKNESWLRETGIAPEDAQKDLYGVDISSGKIGKGYEFYVMLSRNVVLLLPLFPLLVIGRYLGGRAIYRFVAERRTRLFGVCELPTPKPSYEVVPSGAVLKRGLSGEDAIAPFSLQFLVLGLAYMLAIPSPYLGWSGVPMPGNIAQTMRDAGAASARVYGIGPIDVFNETDLRMAENWFVVSGVRPDGEEVLLPIFAERGTRLAMHRSDRVYFGHTVRFRRSTIGLEGCFFESHGNGVRYLAERYRTSGAFDRLIYRQYLQLLPPSEQILQGRMEAQSVVKICEIEF